MKNFNKYCLSRALVTSKGEVLTSLNNLINKLDKCFKKDNDNFAEICFVVFKIKKLFDEYRQVNVYNKRNETYTFETIMTGFGISKSETSRLLSVYDKFCCLSSSDLSEATCKIIEEFKGFSKSKLFELLQVDNRQIFEDLRKQVLRYDFSVKQIRDYVKNLQNLAKQQAKLNEVEDKQEEFIEENIPMAYNPEQHYDFDYFEDKNKAQLLNIVWELQKEYEKLKTKYLKLKKEKN